MRKYTAITVLLTLLASVPAIAFEFKTRVKEYADTCYHIPKDKLRIIVIPVTMSDKASASKNDDFTIRPYGELTRAPHSRYTVMALTPPHLFQRVEQGALTGLIANFRANLVSTQTSILTSYEPPVEYSYDFRTIGYFDIDPAKLPLKFDIQIEEEIGTKTVAKENDYTNTIKGYEGGKCVIKGLYIYKNE